MRSWKNLFRPSDVTHEYVNFWKWLLLITINTKAIIQIRYDNKQIFEAYRVLLHNMCAWCQNFKYCWKLYAAHGNLYVVICTILKNAHVRYRIIDFSPSFGSGSPIPCNGCKMRDILLQDGTKSKRMRQKFQIQERTQMWALHSSPTYLSFSISPNTAYRLMHSFMLTSVIHLISLRKFGY